MTNDLESIFAQGVRCGGWLVETGCLQDTLVRIQYLVSERLLSSDVPSQHHPDYRCVVCDPSAKNISIEQIRVLYEFLNSTSVVSGHKVAVIYQADLMSLSAASACLKILEDIPQGSIIFLVTARAASIIPTLRSRCFRINILDSDISRPEKQEYYNQIIALVTGSFDCNKKIDFIGEFSKKHRAGWLDLSNSILYLISKIIKKSCGVNVTLSEHECAIMRRFSHSSPAYLIQKYYDIKRIVYSTITYDLDLRSSCLLLIEELTSMRD